MLQLVETRLLMRLACGSVNTQQAPHGEHDVSFRINVVLEMAWCRILAVKSNTISLEP